MITPSRLVSILLFLMLFIGACNLPSSVQTPENAGAVLTAAAQTVAANLTQSAQQNPSTPIPTSTPDVPTATSAVSPTSPSTAETATQDCDKAEFVTDVTIPDGTKLSPNEAFTKTWRIKNTGTCSWTPSYSFVFDNGDAMDGPATQAMVGNVNPGETIDISVNLKAPAADGSYKGYWKLRNAAGVLFTMVYVDIKVGDGGGGPFAVTNVSMSVSGGCGNFQIKADITANGAGIVTYNWKRSDGAIDNAIHPDVVFDSAGTKSVTTSWITNAAGSKWMDIYIDQPNHQQFGRANFSCP